MPIGAINLRGNEHGLSGERYTRYSKEEQRTLLSLWCIFRSPVMLGCELTHNDDWTLSLLTNPAVLRLLTPDTAG